MNNKFKEIFNQIQAEEELKNETKVFLSKKTHGYTEVKNVKPRYYVLAAACVCLLLVIGIGCGFYYTPIAGISIDINPSIELSINRFNHVIYVKDVNEDGQELLNTVDVKYKNYTEAIEEILNNNMIIDLFSDNEVMAITVTGPDDTQSAKIFSEIENCTARKENTYCYFISSEKVTSAHEAGLSCGKYRAFLELQLLDPDITIETVKDMTMKEIRELMDTLTSDSENDSAQCGNCGSGHHGNGSGHGFGRKNKTDEN